MRNTHPDMSFHHTRRATQIPSPAPREGDGRAVMNEAGGGVRGDKRAVHNDT